MPLHDHFRAPFDNVASWEEFHGQWPAMLVLCLRAKLPRLYVAGPRVHAMSEYEVRVYEIGRERNLVAAIEIVSPANKDRPEHRRAFVAKCATLLQNQISLVIIDLVTTRGFNLYRDLLDLIGQSDPALGAESMPIYAVACRSTKPNDSWQLDTWLHPLQIGQPLPTLPLWLADNFSIALDLEESYEDTCKALGIG